MDEQSDDCLKLKHIHKKIIPGWHETGMDLQTPAECSLPTTTKLQIPAFQGSVDKTTDKTGITC